MIEIKIYTYKTCSDILNYKTDENIRELYNQDSFNFSNSEYLKDTIKLDIKESELELGSNPSDDLLSSITIFNSLNGLDLVQANDKRIWVTLTHTIFFNYVRSRWNIDENSSDDVIKDRFHFEGTALRQRNQNALARLWWGCKITHDTKRDDPFELSKVLWGKQDFYQNLIDRKYSTYSSILEGFLNFYKQNNYLDLKKDMRKLFKGINALGGVRILPLLSKEEVFNQLVELCKFNNISLNDQTNKDLTRLAI